MGLCTGLTGMVWWGWQQEGSQPSPEWLQAAVLAPGSDGFCCPPQVLEGLGGAGHGQVPAELSLQPPGTLEQEGILQPDLRDLSHVPAAFMLK